MSGDSATRRILDAFAAGPRRPLRILGASGQLGYGIPTPAFEAGLARSPDLIGCDMGSIDPGPYYLGSGNLATAPGQTRRDLRKVMAGALKLRIPLVIGTAGSAGAAPHLEQTLAMVREIARTEDWHFRLGVLAGDIDRQVACAAVRAGTVTGIDGMADLTEEEIGASTHLVGQMGMDAFRRAFEAGVDIVIAGRACDAAIFSTLPAMLGFPLGLAVHMAKIIECASLCCLPGGRDTILATLDDEGFELESMAPQRRATPLSVAAHSLYEQGDPYSIIEPEGRADLREARYEAIDERRTRVSGARWIAATEPSVKLEGARVVGERAILMAGAADPRFIAQHRDILPAVAKIVRDLVCEEAEEDYALRWRVYGVDGVTDAQPGAPLPAEVFLLIECIAPTLARAEEVARTMKQYLLHFGYAGRLSTGGNIAFPFTPPEVGMGTAYRFNVYHIMRTPEYASLFPLRVEVL
ncbi:acyclic terpene utilization AtuA family protein [Variovorax sp. KK3]|uniref:acyclic terpene utilization AtuA family protein n=1 Tax=Variovorax sp. KK3 TaxID=1855728 RepID=UPI002118693A|nr:acyclic terpene utilization AtuA family protein [Variovorax sp. KK3]